MNAPNPTIAPAQQKNGARRKGLLILGTVVGIGLLIYAVYWLAYARHFEDTDDAYVASDVIQISSEVPGTVLSVNVDDTQSVQRGQVLVQLDPADAKVALDAAEADLARSVRQVRALFAQTSQLKSQLAERQADYDRRKGLTRDGAVSKEELSHAQTALAAVQEQLEATLAQTEGTTIATHPQVLAAVAKVRDAALALHRSQITAPVAGVIAKRGVQVGARIAPGAPLMAVIPLDDVWVDANFKEVQLRNMRVGQPVTLRSDVYGGGATFHGHIAGLSAGSGSAFALLPAQNASGNWIKVVQRVPVRIALDHAELGEHPLRLGLSMSAQVDVRDASGPLVSDKVRSQPHPQIASDENSGDTETRIAKIITDNTGGAEFAPATAQ